MDSCFLGQYGTIAVVLHGRTTQWWGCFAMHHASSFSQLVHIMFTRSLQRMTPAWSKSHMSFCLTGPSAPQ